MTISQVLWRDSADLAAAALGHPFVRGLADGTLPRERFAAYIAQDAFYLESFARAYALAAAHSPDRAGLEAFAELLAGTRRELTLHASYASVLGVDLAAVEPAPATQTYTDFLLANAATGGLGRTCAAMTPCMRLYAYLGQSLAESRTSDTYAEWIDTYANPEFGALAGRLESLLDTYATGSDRERRTYRRAMQLEVDFFESAYTGG